MPDYSDLRYQVFVSSTFRDLQEERQKVLQAILEMKAFPAGMELFPSADDEQFEFIKREIESSDYYVAIIAGKYGSLAPDGVSFTEKEYDYAVQSGKPVMAFLFHDLGQLKGIHLETDPDARNKLETFRAKVAKGKLVKFYKNSDELKSQVWQALTHAFRLKPGQGWVPAKNASRIEDLQEINRLQKRFMEAEAEIAVLKAAAKDPREQLAQGEHRAEWTLQLQRSAPGMPFPQPPVPEFRFEPTWNELVLACFTTSFPDAKVWSVREGLMKLATHYFLSAFPDHADWLARHPPTDPFDEESSAGLIKYVKRQFLGLGYLDVDGSNTSHETWILTDLGKRQLALLGGAIRKTGG